MIDSKSQEKSGREKNKNLLIVFVKNSILGNVKTRLAKTIGDTGAFKIYSELVNITEKITSKITDDKHIYFSDAIISSKWKDDIKFIQEGKDLGDKMQNAFQNGFDEGYKNILLIGSDLPTISEKIIETGFDKLSQNDVVFGPAEDGGYYLIGMSKMIPSIFKNKPWSQSTLLTVTLAELKKQQQKVGFLKTLNDIDTFEDLIHSGFYKNSLRIQEITQQNKAIK